MDAPGFLAHGDDAAAGGFCGREVDVRELGECVADRVIDGALADFSAFNVCDGNAECERGGGWREHLVAVGDEGEQIGMPVGERIGEPKNSEPDVFGHGGVGVGAEQAFDASLDGEAVALDLADCAAESRRKMRAKGKDAEFDVRPRGEFAERPVEMAVVGTGGSDDADAALASVERAAICGGGIHRGSISIAWSRCAAMTAVSGIASRIHW